MRCRIQLKVRWWMCVVALLIALQARAADYESDAIRLLDKGYDLYLKGDPASLAEARKTFEAARALFPNKPNPYRLLGLTDARLGHCQEAVHNLELYLKLAKPDDPRIAEATAARDRCAQTIGTLEVESVPPGAEVRIDQAQSAQLGVTPFKSDTIALGTHRLFLTSPGYTRWSESVTIEGGAVTRRAVRLLAALAAVETKPRAAPTEPPPKRSRRRVGIAVGLSVAAAALIAGAVAIGVVASRSSPYDSAPRLPEVHGN
jgi:hypothetical protein